MIFLNKLITVILGRNLEISKEIPFSYFFGIIILRLKMLIIGILKSPFLKERGKILFIGTKVTLRCKNMIVLKSGVTLNDYVYIDALSTEGIILSKNVSIGMRTVIKTSGSLQKIGKGLFIGENSALGNDCFIGAAGGVEIGENVAIGQNVRFHSEDHEFRDVKKLISEQGVTNKGIKICSDCWIGAGAVILDGVTIDKGSVIGANSVVTFNIPEYAIAVGSPARIVGYRS